MFIRSQFCTPSCGKSQFEDWLHTPACESAYLADLGAKDREDAIRILAESVTADFCFICNRATDHRGEH